MKNFLGFILGIVVGIAILFVMSYFKVDLNESISKITNPDSIMLTTVEAKPLTTETDNVKVVTLSSKNERTFGENVKFSLAKLYKFAEQLSGVQADMTGEGYSYELSR